MDHKLLSIYLNDHLAAATGMAQLARRAAGSNRDSEYGPFLSELAGEVAEDREALLELMRALGVGTDRAKVVAGWSAEKLGRLKPNGRLLSYSPLSRVVELEALTMGVRGKHSLWTALERVARDEAEIPAERLAGLIARAERQLAGLDQHRVRAVHEALTG